VANAVGEDRSDFQTGGRSWSEDDFGFTKATEGTGWTSSTFAANWSNLRAEGKHRGAYHFFHPAYSAGAQAAFFVNFVKAHGGFGPGDMFACDAEISVGNDGMELASEQTLARMNLSCQQVPVNLRPASVSSGALVFCEAVANLVGPQCPVLLYTYASFLGQVASCAKFPLWVADYSSRPPASVSPWSRWTMWQNADTGGQGGGDRNYFNGTAAALSGWIESYAAPGQVQITVQLPTLALGDADHAGANQAVGKMQALLSFVGTTNHIPAAAGLAQDGNFGPGTLAAVEAVQAFYGIAGGGGQCGARTWEHLLAG
jgi:GH25 family lysozyme M1 (1,4-beta-N-acetylmuramidase)